MNFNVVVVDVDAEKIRLNREPFERAVTAHAVAVVTTHLYGLSLLAWIRLLSVTTINESA